MAGNSSVRGDQTVTHTDNMSFDGTDRSGAMSLDGQLWIGATASDRANNGGHVRLGTLTAGAGITIANGPGTITISSSGGATSVDSFAMQTGTSPVVPDGAGLVTFNGAVVAQGNNPVRTNGTAANTMQLEVQISQVNATPDSSQNGLAHFNSTQFSVDADGFVSTSTTGVINTLTGNSGGAISPTSGNINTLGTGSITIAGAGSTLTTQLTGLTNHAVLVGAGTATITNVGPTATAGQVLQSAGAAADPAFSTATYPLTTTVSQILYSSATNTVTGLATANRAVLTTGTTGIPVLTALAADGQLIIGSTAGAPAAATLTAGTGITITNGSNSITISANGSVVVETLTGDTGGALSPTTGNINILGGPGITVTGSGSTLTVNSVVFTDTAATTMAVDNGYFATAAGTYNLPATAVQGELIHIVCDTAGAVVVDAPALNFIRMGSAISAASGTATSSAIGDSLTLRYRLSTLTWYVTAAQGIWTIT